jgi:hypothetical protein
MSEFKFACPVCTQHIRCDSAQSGSVMDCPTCLQKIIVPFAPASADSPIVPTGQRYVEKKPEPLPEPVPPPPEAGVPTPVLVGLLVALAVVALGVAWWHWQHGTAPQPGSVVIHEPATSPAANSPAPPPPAVVPHASDTLWMLDVADATVPANLAAGRLHDQDFLAEHSLFQDGVLTFRTAQRGPLNFGLQINFQGAAPEALAGKTIEVDTNADRAATVTLRWNDNGAAQKSAFSAGYALHLEFGAVKKNHLPGKIYLCLPDPEKSYLAGTFNAELRKPKPKQ